MIAMRMMQGWVSSETVLKEAKTSETNNYAIPNEKKSEFFLSDGNREKGPVPPHLPDSRYKAKSNCGDTRLEFANG